MTQWSLGLCAAIVFGAPAVWAQTVPATPAPATLPGQPTAPPLPTLPERIGVGAAAPLTLTLSDAIRMTLEHNTDVSVARLDVDASRLDVQIAQGVFDPIFTPSLSYQRTVTANTSAIGGAREGRLEQTQLAGGAGLVGRSPWAGGRFSLDFSSSRLESSNQFARLNPQYPSDLTASYVQPLFRGRSIDADRRSVLLARRAVDLTDAQLTQVLMDQLTLVEQSYWDLAFAARNLEVLTTALAQAQAQVSSNERQAKEGTLAPIDVVEAQIQAANFRQAVASGQQALTAAENRLKRLMLANRASPVWNQAIVPGELSDRTTPTITLDQGVQSALTRRPELSALESTRAQNEIDRAFYRDQTRPSVNLVGGYTISGLAGTTLSNTAPPPVGEDTDDAVLNRLNQLSLLAGLSPLDAPPVTDTAVPGFLIGDYGRSLNNLLARRFPTAVVQLQMELPFRNRAAKASLARTELVGTQIDRRRDQLEQAIESEVRDALQAVRSSEERLAAAASARRNALEQYDSERRRFDSGLATVFLVLERQTALVTAQADELRARADLNQSIAGLERAIGGTLDLHGVKLQ